MTTVATKAALGAHSEVGALRTVMVHRPDIAHERLTPTNCHDLLFDDVIWVRRARQEFDAFIDLMRDRGVEVLLLHDLLAETLANPEAREWVLSRRLRPEEVTALFSRELIAWMTEMDAGELATKLTGGVTLSELPVEIVAAVGRAMQREDFVLAPLPNQLFTRDPSAWIYGGVTLNPMFWPARRKETLNLEAIPSSRRSGTSGTTATTSSPSRRASSWPTSATRQRTRSSPRRASRCLPSPARSSAAAAAEATA